VALSLARADGEPGSAPLATTLIVLSFVVVEYTDGADPPSQWYFAPLIRVAETSSAGRATIERVELAIAGAGGPPPTVAFSGLSLGPGESRDLFGEMYGDYEFSYYEIGLRTHFCDVTAVITYRDATGRRQTVTAHGPVVPGARPVTYTRVRASPLPIPGP
jgi:hypothetical protein